MTDQTARQPLEHTQGGVHTRADTTDVGVPMAAPTGPQTVGPEDAAGLKPTRGDYTARTSTGTSIEPIPPAEQVPNGPRVRVVHQGAGATPPAA